MVFSPNNRSGRASTVMLVIIATLLITLTASSVFYLQKEKEQRKVMEQVLEKRKEEVASLRDELESMKSRFYVLQEKNKDADERINNLMDDLDLESGLREELKTENTGLRDQIAAFKKEVDTLKAQLSSGNSQTQEKVAELEKRLKEQIILKDNLEKKLALAEDRSQRLKEYAEHLESGLAATQQNFNIPPQPQLDLLKTAGANVNLEKIVVVPDSLPDGRIVSVDSTTEFVIVNLGAKDGVKLGHILSVYRGKEYLGDIKITRVQPEMSAADLIPPFSSRLVRKNDQVIVKQ